MNNAKKIEQMKFIEIFMKIRRAYSGAFEINDDNLKDIKKEIKNIEISSKQDRINLKKDRNNVANDLKKSLEKYETCNL